MKIEIRFNDGTREEYDNVAFISVVNDDYILSPCHCLHCGLILNSPQEMQAHLIEKHCGGNR